MNSLLRLVLLWVCFIGSSFMLAADDMKIAFIGDSKEAEALADIVLVTMSQEKGVSVFERQEIDKILKEHKLQKGGLTSNEVILLSKFVHVDFFILINSVKDKTVTPSGVMIFDAETGARLLDRAIPSQNPSAFLVDEIKATLKNSDDKTSRKLISVLSVRNAGVPSKYNYQLANIAAETERNLSASKDIAVLERANLALVNNERNLTSELYKLSPSAYLLDFEASPGDSTEKVILKVYVLNTSGMELAKFKIDDCISNPSAALKKLLAELSGFLSVSAPLQSSSPQAEAARFLKEYKYSELSGDWEAAERKIEAAVALNPNSPDYRRELAHFIARKAANYPKNIPAGKRFPNMISSGMKMLEICNDIKEQFPDYKGELYYSPNFCSIFMKIIDTKNALTVEQKKEAREFADIWRPLRCEEMKKQVYWKFDLTDGINSIEELNRYKNFLVFSNQPHFYMDTAKYVEAHFENMKGIFKYGADFANKNPEIIKRLSCFDQNLKFILDDIIIFGQDEVLYALFIEKLKNSQELIEMAKLHPVPAVKVYGHTLELIRNTILNNYDKKLFEKDLDEMINTIAQVEDFKHSIDIYKSTITPLPLGYFFMSSHNELFKAYAMGTIRLCRKFKRLPDIGVLRCLSNNLEKNKVLADRIEYMEPEITAWLKPANGDERSTACISDIKTYFSYLKSQLDSSDPDCQKALKILNPSDNIKIMTEKFKFPSDKIDTSVMYDNKVYALSRRDWQIYEFDPANSSFSALTKITPVNALSTGLKTPIVMGIDDKYILLGGTEAIHVIERDNGKECVIKDLPAENVNAVTVMNDRIYAFVGREGPGGLQDAREVVLFSFLPDGTDRKIHISTMRSDKKTLFDKQKPFRVDSLFSDSKKKRLLFTCGIPLAGLWEFNPETDEGKRLIDFKDSSKSWGMQIGSMLYIASGLAWNLYYTFDMATDKKSFVFFRENASALKYIGAKPVAMSNIWVAPPFFTKNDQIWFSSSNVVYGELSSIDNYVNIDGITNLTHYTPVFPHPDGISVLVVTSDSIYKVTPVEQRVNP